VTKRGRFPWAVPMGFPAREPDWGTSAFRYESRGLLLVPLTTRFPIILRAAGTSSSRGNLAGFAVGASPVPAPIYPKEYRRAQGNEGKRNQALMCRPARATKGCDNARASTESNPARRGVPAVPFAHGRSVRDRQSKGPHPCPWPFQKLLRARGRRAPTATSTPRLTVPTFSTAAWRSFTLPAPKAFGLGRTVRPCACRPFATRGGRRLLVR
jgi:hypothetical protein